MPTAKTDVGVGRLKSNVDPFPQTKPIGAQEEGRTQEEECAQEEGRELTDACNLYLSGCTIFHLMLTPTTLGSQEEGRDQEEDRAEEEGRHQEDDRRKEVNSSASCTICDANLLSSSTR